MSDPLFKDRLCVRAPQTQEELLELITKLENGELDDLPVTAAIHLCKKLDISPERLFELFDESESA